MPTFDFKGYLSGQSDQQKKDQPQVDNSGATISKVSADQFKNYFSKGDTSFGVKAQPAGTAEAQTGQALFNKGFQVAGIVQQAVADALQMPAGTDLTPAAPEPLPHQNLLDIAKYIPALSQTVSNIESQPATQSLYRAGAAVVDHLLNTPLGMSSDYNALTSAFNRVNVHDYVLNATQGINDAQTTGKQAFDVLQKNPGDTAAQAKLTSSSNQEMLYRAVAGQNVTSSDFMYNYERGIINSGSAADFMKNNPTADLQKVQQDITNYLNGTDPAKLNYKYSPQFIDQLSRNQADQPNSPYLTGLFMPQYNPTFSTLPKDFQETVKNTPADVGSSVGDTLYKFRTELGSQIGGFGYGSAGAGGDVTGPNSNTAAYMQSPVHTLERYTNLIGSSVIGGASLGAIPTTPKEGQAKDTPEVVTQAMGNALGSFASIMAISNTIKRIAEGSDTLANMMKNVKNPVTGQWETPILKTLYPYIQNAIAFTAAGQVNPDQNFSQRLKTFAMDLATSIPFSMIGNAPVKVSLPSSVGIGYVSTILATGDPKQAAVQGIILGLMDGLGKLGYEGPGRSFTDIGNEINDKKAMFMLSIFSDKPISLNSSPEEVKAAYIKAMQSIYPEAGSKISTNTTPTEENLNVSDYAKATNRIYAANIADYSMRQVLRDFTPNIDNGALIKESGIDTQRMLADAKTVAPIVAVDPTIIDMNATPREPVPVEAQLQHISDFTSGLAENDPAAQELKQAIAKVIPGADTGNIDVANLPTAIKTALENKAAGITPSATETQTPVKTKPVATQTAAEVKPADLMTTRLMDIPNHRDISVIESLGNEAMKYAMEKMPGLAANKDHQQLLDEQIRSVLEKPKMQDLISNIHQIVDDLLPASAVKNARQSLTNDFVRQLPFQLADHIDNNKFTLNTYTKDGAKVLDVYLAIKKADQHQGYGTQILSQLNDYGVKQGATSMVINSVPEAVGFWQKQGFTTTGAAEHGLTPMSKEIMPNTAKGVTEIKTGNGLKVTAGRLIPEKPKELTPEEIYKKQRKLVINMPSLKGHSYASLDTFQQKDKTFSFNTDINLPGNVAHTGLRGSYRTQKAAIEAGLKYMEDYVQKAIVNESDKADIAKIQHEIDMTAKIYGIQLPQPKTALPEKPVQTETAPVRNIKTEVELSQKGSEKTKLVRGGEPTVTNLKPAEMQEKNVFVKPGDYIVDDNGELKVVINGNAEHEGKKGYNDEQGAGYIRDQAIGRHQIENGKDIGYMDYANQIRLATPAEIKAAQPEIDQHNAEEAALSKAAEASQPTSKKPAPIEIGKTEIKSGIIKANEQATPQPQISSPGRNANNEGLSKPVPVVQEQPERTRANSAVPSENVSSTEAVTRDSNGGLGERPAEQLKSIPKRIQANQEVESIIQSKPPEQRMTPGAYTPSEIYKMKAFTGYGGTGAREKRGVLDEFYTPKEVVHFTYSKLSEFAGGLDGIKSILEPAAGAGAFIEHGPFDPSLFTAYEINPTSAAIAQAIFPTSEIRNRNFSEAFVQGKKPLGDLETPAERYDLVIGNPPYGKYGGYYKGLGEGALARTYEEYFIYRALAATNPGGYVAMIVPSSFMRGGNTPIKIAIGYMSSDFKAYRLPNGLFKGTDVGVDLVMFKKAQQPGYYNTSTRGLITNDSYFDGRTSNVLGTPTEVKNRFGDMVPAVNGTIDKVIESTGKIAPVDTKNEQRTLVKTQEPTTPAKIKPPSKQLIARVLTTHKGTGTTHTVTTENIHKDILAGLENTNASGFVNQSFIDTLSPAQLQDNFSYNNGRWYTDMTYLNNVNLYDQLDQLERDKAEMTPGQYQKQESLVKQAMPAPIKINNIKVPPTARTWEEIKMLEPDGTEATRSVTDDFRHAIGEYPNDMLEGIGRDNINNYLDRKPIVTSKFFTEAEAAAIKNKTPQVTRRLFAHYLADIAANNEAMTARIEAQFNRSQNAYVRMDYTKVPLLAPVNDLFKGQPLNFNDAQRQAMGFLLTSGKGISALDVGVGKTLSTVIATNELFHRGWAKRSLILTPNPNVAAQWIKTIKEALPNANILDLRKVADVPKLKGIKIPEKTFIIAPAGILDKIVYSQETFQQIKPQLQEMLDNLGAEGSAREEEGKKAKLEEMLGIVDKTAGVARPDALFFDTLGIDHLTIDEAHNYNHVFATVPSGVNQDGKASRNNEYKSLQMTPSKRGIKAFVMGRYILSNNYNRNVFLLTATPFQNNPLEIYTMLSMVGKEDLEARGLVNIRDFVENYMNISNEQVIGADGRVKNADIIKSFQNFDSFRQLLSGNMLQIDGEDAGIVRPNRIDNQVFVNASPAQFANGRKIALQYAEAQAKLKSLPWNNKEARKEQQAIVLKAMSDMGLNSYSPYAVSTAHGPLTAKDFVENTPKIKAMMEIIRQNQKDNPKGRYIIYQHWTTNNHTNYKYMDLIKQYLQSELGYKANELGMITGEVSQGQRVDIQKAFNEGDVKIVIGNYAMAEGVDLNKQTSDIFILTPFWNYTQFRQLIGRGWRQGNMWQNIRIHTFLGKDTGDAFVSEKIKQKEVRDKQIRKAVQEGKKVYALDGDEITFSDVLDQLITDPVERLKIQKQQEVRKLDGEIASKSAAFQHADHIFNRENRTTLERNIASNQTAIKQVNEMIAESKTAVDELIKQGKAENDYSLQVEKNNLEYRQQRKATYQSEIRGYEKTLRTLQETEVKEKITQAYIDELKTKLDTAKQNKETLDSKYKTLEDAAKLERDAMKPQITDYKAIAADVAEQNKTFYQLRDDLKVPTTTGDGNQVVDVASRIANEKTVTPAVRASAAPPRAHADRGGYSDVKSVQKMLGNVNPLELPEMLELYHNISGKYPTLSSRFTVTMGQAMGIDIKLARQIFATPGLPEKVLAHEIGHVADYLPDEVDTRGNLIGRIKSITGYIKDTFGDLKNGELKSELRKLTQLWKPFNEGEDPEYTKYRYSSEELYADALSVLLNDPDLLAQEAPKFFQAFMDNLNNKPQVAEEFLKMWTRLNDGPEAVYSHRLENLDKMALSSEQKLTALQADKGAVNKSLVFRLKYLIQNKNQIAVDKVNQARRAGQEVPPEINPVYALEEGNYNQGEIADYVQRNFGGIEKTLKGNGISWDDFGKALMLRRIIYERTEIANPYGYTPATAQPTLDALEKRMTPTQVEILREQYQKFRSAIQVVVDKADKLGFYSPETVKMMKANPVYATFAVIDYMEKNMAPTIFHQKGTFKEIVNPATATLLKMVSIYSAMQRNQTKNTFISFLSQLFPDEIKEAEFAWKDGKMRMLEPRDRNLGLLKVMREGKFQGFYVDRYIAKTMNYMPNEDLKWAAQILRMPNKIYRPLFTTLNPGYYGFKFAKNFLRYWKNTPDANIGEALTSFPRAIYRYGQAAPHALKRATHQLDNVISEMEKAHILGITYNDMFTSPDPADKAINRIIQQAGLGVLTQRRRIFFLKPYYMLANAMQGIGNFLETLPKVAGYYELKGKYPTQEMGHIIRQRLGSPDYLQQGAFTSITNQLFPFSNGIIQGIAADWSSGTDPKTRAGVWWKTMLTSILPKLFMLAAASGLLGKTLKDQMDAIGEYDKTNYNIIPLGMDANGKAVILRLPLDETSRLAGGIFWKLAHLNKDDLNSWMQTIDFGAGQLPTISPAIQGGLATLEYFSGQNPYDWFRGQTVIPDLQFKAGPAYSFPVFMNWLVQNQGLGIIAPKITADDPKSMSGLEKAINLPVMFNMVGRWLKVTNQGLSEAGVQATALQNQASAQQTLEHQAELDTQITNYFNSQRTSTDKLQAKNAYIDAVVGHAAPFKGTDKSKATTAGNAFEQELLRRSGNVNYKNLTYTKGAQIAAGSNIPVDTKMSDGSLLSQVLTYAQAIGTDPETAFNRIFSGQKIVRVSNGTVIVQRMSLQDSTAVKKAGGGNNPSMKLDHTVPLEIGGSNDQSNLKLVSTATWQSYTPVEDALGRALIAGKISKSDAQSEIQRFKGITDPSLRKIYGDKLIAKYR